jgi:SAM-dependent methyltransferase
MSSSLPLTENVSRWDSARAPSYDDKWQQMAKAGENPHGEADFVARFTPASVLDAGCGTGRVAIELAARGLDVAGSDIDGHMLAQAQAKAPELTWVESDLASLDLGRTFDVVVMAGNVILFVEPGTEEGCIAGAARHVGAGGYLIAGFSLARGVTADAWEGWLRNADLEPVDRFSSWSGDPFADSDYLVSVARRSSQV